MKKMLKMILAALATLLIGACAKDAAVPASVAVPAATPAAVQQNSTVAQSPDYNQFQGALTDTTYKEAPVSTTVRPLESNEGSLVKPTPELEKLQPTVTGQNPAVAAKAGYPVSNVKDNAKANMDGINDFVGAVTDTSYVNDKITPENTVLPSNAGIVKPTPELEKLQPTVTGQNPAVAEKAGYPIANVKDDAKAKMDGIDSFVSAVTDTTYVNDKVTPKKDGVILSTD